LNQKERQVVENVTLRRIKDISEKQLNDQWFSYQEYVNQKAWLLHWILVYSFTTPKSEGLFGQLLSDRFTYGGYFLNIVQIKAPHLLRYMVASLLLESQSEQL
jgi:hypothetical protein